MIDNPNDVAVNEIDIDEEIKLFEWYDSEEGLKMQRFEHSGGNSGVLVTEV